MSGGVGNLIFVRNHPTMDGRLQSPVALLQRSRMMLRWMMDDQSYASHWMAHPLFAFEVNKNFYGGGGGGGGGGATTGRETYGLGHFANADILDEHQKYRFERQRAEMIDLQLSRAAAS